MTLKELFAFFDTTEYEREQDILENKLAEGMTLAQAVLVTDRELGKAY
jgi:hypothetical protein